MGPRTPLAFVLVCTLAGCTIDVPLEGKRCDANGNCPDALVCNAQQICVGSLECSADRPCSAGSTCIQGSCVDGIFAADWTDAMAAVYRFDSEDLGRDATGGGRYLELVGAPALGTQEPPRGDGFAELGEGDLFTIVDPIFASGANRSLTVGGWFRVDDAAVSSARLISRRIDQTDSGFAITWERGENRFACLAGPTAHASPVDSITVGAWHHVVCRIEAVLEYVTNVHDGVGPDDDRGTSVNASDVGDAGADAPFAISAAANGFAGGVDEVFFVNRDLSTRSIRRIYACGIDGRGCRCDPANPSAYLECGPVAVCDTDLVPCDLAGPTTRTEEQTQ